jgi:leucine dehydrogenase
MLQDKGILYAPDYVINAGGLINVYYEYQARLGKLKYNLDTVMADVEKIFDTTTMIFERAETDGITIAEAADRIAEDRFNNAKPITDIAA